MTSRRSIAEWDARLSRSLQFRAGHVGGRVDSAQPIRRNGGSLRRAPVATVTTPYVPESISPYPWMISLEHLKVSNRPVFGGPGIYDLQWGIMNVIRDGLDDVLVDPPEDGVGYVTIYVGPDPVAEGYYVDGLWTDLTFGTVGDGGAMDLKFWRRNGATYFPPGDYLYFIANNGTSNLPLPGDEVPGPDPIDSPSLVASMGVDPMWIVYPSVDVNSSGYALDEDYPGRIWCYVVAEGG